MQMFLFLELYIGFRNLDNNTIYQYFNLGDNGGIKDFINIKIK